MAKTDAVGWISKPGPDGTVIVTIGDTKYPAKLTHKAARMVEAEFDGKSLLHMMQQTPTMEETEAILFWALQHKDNAAAPGRDRVEELIEILSDQHGIFSLTTVCLALINAAYAGNRKAPARNKSTK